MLRRQKSLLGLVSPLEAYGNEAADKLAARGALRNALSMEYVAATRHTDNCVWLVQTRLIEINLVHVQNRTKTIRVRHAAPERRAKFDPDEAMRQLNRIGHDFRRIQVGKGRFTYKCRFCLLRGEKPFLKQLLGKPCSVVSRIRSVALPPTPASTPIPEEPESFFIGDNPSSEEDPFGWGGDFDQDHQDLSDQALQQPAENLKSTPEQVSDNEGDTPKPIADLEDLSVPADEKTDKRRKKTILGANPREARNLIRAEMPQGFYTCISGKKKFRTLHRLGDCFSIPGIDYADCVFHGKEVPPRSAYDSVCRLCSKKSSPKGTTRQGQKLPLLPQTKNKRNHS